MPRTIAAVSLLVDDYDRAIRFYTEPRREAYGRVVVFLDLHGNRWDLIEPIEAGP